MIDEDNICDNTMTARNEVSVSDSRQDSHPTEKPTKSPRMESGNLLIDN